MTMYPDHKSNPDWKKTLLPAGATLKQAIESLDKSAMQIALLVSENGVLKGTLTDGDIRRGLLRGLDMDSTVDNIVFREPLVVPPEMNRDMVLHLMRVNKLRQIPVVDENRKVLGLHLWEQIGKHSSRPNSIVIMAGGMGTRLRPHTENCPKPMLEVAGKPMLEHIIERAKLDGFEHFILAIHYLGYMVENYFGNGQKLGVVIEYLKENSPLGTAGALSLLDPKPESSVLVSNGDVLTDIRYGEMLDFHIRQDACATMAVRLHEWQYPFGIVKTRGVDIVGFEEKPTYKMHINAGIYALSSEALGCLSHGEHCDMPALFERLQEYGKRTVVYPMHEPWLDVARPEDLQLAKDNSHNQNDLL